MSKKLTANLSVICRDLGYEIGATLKPRNIVELDFAIADLRKLYADLKKNSTNPELHGFLYGVIAALENPHQKD